MSKDAPGDVKSAANEVETLQGEGEGLVRDKGVLGPAITEVDVRRGVAGHYIIY